jgi:hypothetical protein
MIVEETNNNNMLFTVAALEMFNSVLMLTHS